MPYILGVDVGPSLTGWATVSSEPGDGQSVRGATVASMVALTTDGRLLAGADVAQAIPASLLYTARNFVGHLGEVAPVMVGLTPYGAESLVGHLVASVLGAVQRQHGSRPVMVAFAHADGLDDYRTGLLIEAARLAGVLVSDVALVAHLEARRALVDAAIVVPNSIELAAGAALVARERRSAAVAAFPPPVGEVSTGAVVAGGAALGVGGAVLGATALGDVAAAAPSALAGTGFAGTPLATSGAGFVGTAHVLPGTGFAGTPLATPGTGFAGTPLATPGTGFAGTPLESSGADVARSAHTPPGAGGGGTPPDEPPRTETDAQAAQSKSLRPRRWPAMFAAAVVVVVGAGAAVALITQADSSSAPPVVTDIAVEPETSAGLVEPHTTPPPVVTDPATVVPTPAPTPLTTTTPATTTPVTTTPVTTTTSKDQTAVWVRFERPASAGVLAGNVVEIYGCEGPFGAWQGVLRSGGLDDGKGFVVPFAEIPLLFAFDGVGAQTTHTATSGNVPTPVGNFTVAFELDIGIDAGATTMSLTGQGTAGSNIISVSDYLGNLGSALPIEPAPPGSCL